MRGLAGGDKSLIGDSDQTGPHRRRQARAANSAKPISAVIGVVVRIIGPNSDAGIHGNIGNRPLSGALHVVLIRRLGFVRAGAAAAAAPGAFRRPGEGAGVRNGSCSPDCDNIGRISRIAAGRAVVAGSAQEGDTGNLKLRIETGLAGEFGRIAIRARGREAHRDDRTDTAPSVAAANKSVSELLLASTSTMLAPGAMACAIPRPTIPRLPNCRPWDRPGRIDGRQRGRIAGALLIHHAKAGRGRQAVSRVERRQVAGDRGIVVGVDDGNRLPGTIAGSGAKINAVVGIGRFHRLGPEIIVIRRRCLHEAGGPLPPRSSPPPPPPEQQRSIAGDPPKAPAAAPADR